MPRQELVKSIADDYGASHTYTLMQHPADEGFELLQVILRIVGNVGGVFIDAIDGEDDDAEINGEKLGAAVAAFSQELVTSGGTDFCKKLLKYTTRVNEDGKEQKVAPNFAQIYQGNYGELAMAVWFAVDSNFGPSLRARIGNVDISQKIASLNVLSA
jgi:hypothetical protein